MSKQHNTPCNDCPFSHSVRPGALGGSEPEVYIGQAHGPFFLPCHKYSDFDDPNWKTDVCKPQCAGAAIYRANTERSEQLPSFLLRLSKNTTLVFANAAEFVAHHLQVCLTVARIYLSEQTPQMLMERESAKAKKFITPSKKDKGESNG